jgi:hypothetical protein
MRGIYICKMLILTLALILEIPQFAPTDGMKGPERAISSNRSNKEVHTATHCSCSVSY